MTAENHLQFLDQLQQLLIGSRFTATYKLGLLMALSDLAVENPDDSGSGESIPIRRLAEKMCALYWPHSSPYQSTVPGSTAGVLLQSHLRQAEIIKLICAFRDAHGHPSHYFAMKRLPNDYNALISKITKIVSAKPVQHLQSDGEEFLFVKGARGHIQTKPGVKEALRRFKPLIDHLCRDIWISFIRGLPANRPMLGSQDDLDVFLFSPMRSNVSVLREHLVSLDGPTCFYCGRRSISFDVDHFVPFSMYGRDLAHNFVLACKQCNSAKSDQLACEPYLKKWIDRCASLNERLLEVGEDSGINACWRTTLNVTLWAYALRLSKGNTQGWSPDSAPQNLNGRCIDHLRDAQDLLATQALD